MSNQNNNSNSNISSDLQKEMERKMEEMRKEYEMKEKLRKEKENKIKELNSIVLNDKIKKLFPDVESSSDLVIEMVSLLEIQDEIKSYFFSNLKGRGRGEEVKLSSDHVFLFKLFRGENNSIGVHRIGQEVLPDLNFPVLPYPKSVSIVEGRYDDLLSEDHKKKLNDLDLLGDIRKIKISRGNFDTELKVLDQSL
jgi:hypothetical protein